MNATSQQWPDSDKAELRDLHSKGLSQREVAERLSRSRAAVSRQSARLGLAWDRSGTKTALAAKAVDNETRWRELEATLLVEAEDCLSQLHRPQRYFAFDSRRGGVIEHNAAEPLPIDKLRLVQAASIAIDRAARTRERVSGGAEPTVVVFSGLDKL